MILNITDKENIGLYSTLEGYIGLYFYKKTFNLQVYKKL